MADAVEAHQKRMEEMKNVKLEKPTKIVKIAKKVNLQPINMKDITNDSVTLSSSKKSIVLQVESGVTSQIGTSGFKEEFVKARRNGQAYFEYKGKLYSTDLNN